MGITDGTAGAWAAGTTRNQTVTLPSHSAGQMLLVRVGWKSATPTTDVAFCNTSGWAKLGQFYDGNGASSNGGGGVLVAVFWKVATSAAETNPVIEFDDATAPTPGCWSAVSYNKAASPEEWLDPVGDGGSVAAATSYSGTIQSHVSAAAGDMLDAFVVTNDNTTLTVPTVSQAGLTLDTVTEYPATALSSATSNDIAADGRNRLATAGTSSAAAVVTGTNSVADTGAAWVTRLRVANGASTSPDPVAAVTATPAPAVTTGALASPSPVAAPTAIPAGTLSVGVVLSPSPAAAVLAIPAPTVTAASGDVEVTPDPVAAVMAIPTSTVEAITLVSPTPVAVITDTPTSTVTSGALVAPSPLSATLDVPAPSLAVGRVLASDPVAATAAAPSSTVVVGVIVSPDSVGATLTTPTSAVASGVLLGPSPAPVVLDVPVPTVTAEGAGATSVSPDPAATTLAVPPSVVAVGALASPDPIDILLGIPTIVLAVGAVVAPTPTPAVTAIPVSSVTASGASVPGTVGATTVGIVGGSVGVIAATRDFVGIGATLRDDVGSEP